MSSEQETTEYYNYLLWLERLEFEQELIEIVSVHHTKQKATYLQQPIRLSNRHNASNIKQI